MRPATIATLAIGCVAAVFFALLAFHEHTPAFHNAPHSIASLEKLRLGGADQYILIRGMDVRNPLVLFLHGGPGMPTMYLAHAFQRLLENSFIVVQWDRRGAGKSYSGRIPAATMSVRQEISDTRELVDVLRQRFHKQKVYLVGFSYGSYLGMLAAQRFPELFHAYVGVGQEACSAAEDVDTFRVPTIGRCSLVATTSRRPEPNAYDFATSIDTQKTCAQPSAAQKKSRPTSGRHGVCCGSFLRAPQEAAYPATAAATREASAQQISPGMNACGMSG